MIKLSEPRFTEAEIEQTVKWLNDPVLMKYSEQRHREHTVKSQLKFIHELHAPHQYRKIMYNDTYAGTVTAYIDLPNNLADVGILVGSGLTGHGIGYESWRIFCNELGKQGIRKIEAGCMAQNVAMVRIFEKNHMRLEGTRRYHFWTKDGCDHMLLYGILT